MSRPARIAFVALAVSIVGGCVPQVAPPPVRVPQSRASAAALPPPPPLGADWREWPRTPGDWRYTASPAGGHARYGTGDAVALTLSCDRAARRVTLTRPSPAAATALTVRTTSTMRAIPVQARAPADAAPLMLLDAVLPAGDRLLDAMAFSRGRFVIEQAGQPPLVLPAWAEIGRVIQDCR